jgi:nucleotide-binding universal stress UspA family protein
MRIVFKHRGILVPLYGSESAEQPLPPALAVAEGMEAELVPCGVAVPILRARELKEASRRYYELATAAYREARTFRECRRDRLEYDRLSVAAKPGEGGVSTEIVDHAAENEVDLIEMSNHRLSGVSRCVRGSAAKRVLAGVSSRHSLSASGLAGRKLWEHESLG